MTTLIECTDCGSDVDRGGHMICPMLPVDGPVWPAYFCNACSENRMRGYNRDARQRREARAARRSLVEGISVLLRNLRAAFTAEAGKP